MPCYQIDGLLPVVDPGAYVGANVQDNCTLHGFPGADTLVETDGHIGHGAVLHGCVVQRGALVGMNAVVMDEAEIGEHAIVATSAFIRAGMKVPPRTLVPACRARWCANSAKRRWHGSATAPWFIRRWSVAAMRRCARWRRWRPNDHRWQEGDAGCGSFRALSSRPS